MANGIKGASLQAPLINPFPHNVPPYPNLTNYIFLNKTYYWNRRYFHKDKNTHSGGWAGYTKTLFTDKNGIERTPIPSYTLYP